MKHIWSYLIVAFCATLTSARIMDFPGNRNGFQDNLVTSGKDEKVWTPPTTSGLIIDSNGYPGNSNAARLKNFSPDEFPQLLKEVLDTVFTHSKQLEEYEILPFTKEDIISLENSVLCKMMCKSGVNKPPCKCE